MWRNVYVRQAYLEKKEIYILFIIGEKEKNDKIIHFLLWQINFLNDNSLVLIETKFNSLPYNFKNITLWF